MSKKYGVVGIILTVVIGCIIGIVRFEYGLTEDMIYSMLDSCTKIFPLFLALTGVLLACGVNW